MPRTLFIGGPAHGKMIDVKEGWSDYAVARTAGDFPTTVHYRYQRQRIAFGGSLSVQFFHLEELTAVDAMKLLIETAAGRVEDKAILKQLQQLRICMPYDSPGPSDEAGWRQLKDELTAVINKLKEREMKRGPD